MKSTTLRNLLLMAERAEQAAALLLADLQQQAQRAQQTQAQLHAFGLEYRLTALDGRQGDGRVGFAADALAFGQRLHTTAASQHAACQSLGRQAEAARHALAIAQQRVQSIQKLLDHGLKLELRVRAQAAQREIEEVIGARWQAHRDAGTDRAKSTW
jgi:flagellar export protein FliJ